MEDIEVEFCKETYSSYVEPVEKLHPGFAEKLIEDFRRYKQTQCDEIPEYFGRDAPYEWPPAIAGCLHHIHLCIPPRKFNKRHAQSDRTCSKDNDVALVYAQNKYDLNRYKIIGVLTPAAHAKARCSQTMLYLGGIAREFKHS